MVLTGWGAAGVQARQRQEQLPHFFQGLTLTQNHSDRAQQVQAGLQTLSEMRCGS